MKSGIALGSNIGDRLRNLRAGFRQLLELHDSAGPILVSSIFETSPVDCEPGSPGYLNAVVEIDFALPAIDLLDRLHEIEKQLGRPSRRPRNAPRTLDLDILYVGNLVLNNSEIIIPHPRLTQRRFVLKPLAEIRGELVLPGQTRPIKELLRGLNDTGSVTRIKERLGDE